MNPQAFAVLLEHLPLHAPEGPDRAAVPRTDILGALQTVLPQGEAECLVAVVERLLTLCATLDQQALQRGEWCFVSFPARLCALSLLRSLAEPRQFLFSSDFWEVSPSPHENTLNAQHLVLFWLEQRRLEYFPQATPIRQCAVSAGVIRLARKFWLHRRESQRVRDGNGEYVLPGGRSVFADLEILSGVSFAERLRLLDEAGQLPLAAREQTLKRELREEIGWLYGLDYFFESSRVLPVREKLSGAASNFSHTRYYFTLFELKTTWAGFFKLFQAKKARPGQFAEFSLEELRAGKNRAGQTAYLDILDQAMLDAPDSLPAAYHFDSPAQAVTLPLRTDSPLRQGNARHETILLQAGLLSPAQCRLLWLLGAHGKGLEIVPCQALELLPYGWIRLLDQDLQEVAAGLAERLRDSRLLEIAAPEYFRLSVAPACIFFESLCFSYQLDKRARTITFIRQAQDFAWAEVKAQKLALPVSNSLLNAIHELEQGKDLDFGKNARLESLARAAFEKQGQLASMGLRKFLRIENKHYRIGIHASLGS
jgi:8-oxo-dGTP pyrophosphatase MutT (NUDIX family)